jgi:long-chain acyl-CoA synthetase
VGGSAKRFYWLRHSIRGRLVNKGVIKNSDSHSEFPTHPTVVHMLQDSIARFPDNEAIVFEKSRLTYSDLAYEIKVLSNTLADLGARGERVAIVMSNGPGIVIALFAAYVAGAQAVPLNPDYSERELDQILRDAEALVVICGEAQYSRLGALLDRSARNAALVLPESFGMTGRGGQQQHPFSAPSASDLAMLQYTGGTTGRSKGVSLSHHNVAINVSQREALIPTALGAERILCVTPLYHAYATAMALYPALSSGGALVIQARFKPEHVFDAIENERITLFAGAPSIYNALVGHLEFEKRNLSSLRASFSGSAPLSVEVLQKWENVSGAPIVEGYGLTEASPILTFNPRNGVRKIGSVGVPAPGTTVEIVDSDQGVEVLGRNRLGEVRARGPQLMAGYRNLPEESAHVIRDGWLYTGDLGELDDDGYLFIRGRKKEMVIVGGFNVYPREIEEVLFAHAATLDCAAIGVPDPYRGEVIHAFLVARPGVAVSAEEVSAHCANNLVRYKLPAQIHFVDAIPRTAVGKVDRARLAQYRA